MGAGGPGGAWQQRRSSAGLQLAPTARCSARWMCRATGARCHRRRRWRAANTCMRRAAAWTAMAPTAPGAIFVDDGKGLRIAGPNITTGPGGVVAALPAGGLGARHPPRREPPGPRADDHAQRGLQPLHQRRPGRAGGLHRRCRRHRARAPWWTCPCPCARCTALAPSRTPPRRLTTRCPPQQPVAEGVTLAHGAYVANMCIGCHGEKLAGGKIPGGPPDWPAAANLTPGAGSVMPLYPDADSMIQDVPHRQAPRRRAGQGHAV
jgi:hypothetical protein